ncbi:MAG TPA: hypothetical protein VGV13_13305 [Methylomirabilota bacterium]|jgi:hypothetical protein|nr:hypothetical protein [Methylomirabilota bacterium]
MIASPTIPLSGTLSGIVDVSNAKTLGIWVPVITSGQLYLRGSFDQTSANFVPILTSAGMSAVSSRWYAEVGPGSLGVSFGQELPFPFIMLETSVNQAAVRSLAVFSKGA